MSPSRIVNRKLRSTTPPGKSQAVPLLREAQVALLPAGHRLAGRPAVTTGELRREEGFRERCPTTALDQIVDRVVLDGLIVIIGESAAQRLGSGAVAVPVSDADARQLLLGRRTAGRSAAFVRVARELAAQVLDEVALRLA